MMKAIDHQANHQLIESQNKNAYWERKEHGEVWNEKKKESAELSLEY